MVKGIIVRSREGRQVRKSPETDGEEGVEGGKGWNVGYEVRYDSKRVRRFR